MLKEGDVHCTLTAFVHTMENIEKFFRDCYFFELIPGGIRK